LLKMNQDVAQLDKWDEAAIRNRAETLSDLATRIWPHP